MNPEPLLGIILFFCLIKYSQVFLLNSVFYLYQGKLLLKPATILAKKSASGWKEQDVKPLAEILAERVLLIALEKTDKKHKFLK